MKVSIPALWQGMITALAVLGAAQAGAQNLARTATDRSPDWSFEVSPYLWAAGLDGTIRPRPNGPAFRSSLSFGDILDNLDSGVFISGSARRDRFVMAGDFYYISLSDTVRARPPLEFASVRGKAEVMQGTLVAGWRAVDLPTRSLDLMAGLRAGENDIEVQGRINNRTVLRVTEDITYAAPVLAVRGRVALSDRVSLTGYGDLGGGTSSVDSTWQLSATLDYHLSDRVSVSAGYRHEELDIKNGNGARSSTATSGFLLGTRLRF